MLPVVSRLAERWLDRFPLTMGTGQRFPFRKEFAWLALDGARALQLGQAKRIIFLGDFEEPIYSAAFSAARDLPDEVCEWALEVAQRRKLREDIAEKLKAHRAKEAEEHRQRLATDAEYRERHEQRRHPSLSIRLRRRLPPWPLGPQRSIERDFHQKCLHSPALNGLMPVRPAIAAEVLLACIIEEFSGRAIRPLPVNRSRLRARRRWRRLPGSVLEKPLFWLFPSESRCSVRDPSSACEFLHRAMGGRSARTRTSSTAYGYHLGQWCSSRVKGQF